MGLKGLQVEREAAGMSMASGQPRMVGSSCGTCRQLLQQFLAFFGVECPGVQFTSGRGGHERLASAKSANISRVAAPPVPMSMLQPQIVTVPLKEAGLVASCRNKQQQTNRMF